MKNKRIPVRVFVEDTTVCVQIDNCYKTFLELCHVRSSFGSVKHVIKCHAPEIASFIAPVNLKSAGDAHVARDAFKFCVQISMQKATEYLLKLIMVRCPLLGQLIECVSYYLTLFLTSFDLEFEETIIKQYINLNYLSCDYNAVQKFREYSKEIRSFTQQSNCSTQSALAYLLTMGKLLKVSTNEYGQLPLMVINFNRGV